MTFPSTTKGPRILSVSELTLGIKELMEEAFPAVWVAGEISNLSRPSSGHIYLSLKDAEAQIRAVLWRSAAMRLRFKPTEGLQVIARGRLSVYPPRGDYQLVIDELHVKGLGAQELALRQLKEKLLKLGYFTPERKRRLPAFPRRLALVTSPSGAAVRDMLEILTKRWPFAEVWVCPVRVQGEGAALEVAAALGLLNKLHQVHPVDVLIIGRGGGSTEDLGPFNQESVAHAIFRSSIPVVSAVGHEIDLTIADLVADLRALTPSEAAVKVVPSLAELELSLRDIEDRLRELVAQRIQAGQKRLTELAGRRVFRVPLERVRTHEQKLDDLSARMQRALKRRIAQAGERLQATAGRLESLSPLNVLSRGYSLTRKQADGAVIRRSEQVKAGDLLVTRLQEGEIVSRVENDTSQTGLPPTE